MLNSTYLFDTSLSYSLYEYKFPRPLSEKTYASWICDIVLLQNFMLMAVACSPIPVKKWSKMRVECTKQSSERNGPAKDRKSNPLFSSPTFYRCSYMYMGSAGRTSEEKDLVEETTV